MSLTLTYDAENKTLTVSGIPSWAQYIWIDGDFWFSHEWSYPAYGAPATLSHEIDEEAGAELCFPYPNSAIAYCNGDDDGIFREDTSNTVQFDPWKDERPANDLPENRESVLIDYEGGSLSGDSTKARNSGLGPTGRALYYTLTANKSGRYILNFGAENHGLDDRYLNTPPYNDPEYPWRFQFAVYLKKDEPKNVEVLVLTNDGDCPAWGEFSASYWRMEPTAFVICKRSNHSETIGAWDGPPLRKGSDYWVEIGGSDGSASTFMLGLPAGCSPGGRYFFSYAPYPHSRRVDLEGDGNAGFVPGLSFGGVICCFGNGYVANDDRHYQVRDFEDGTLIADIDFYPDSVNTKPHSNGLVQIIQNVSGHDYLRKYDNQFNLVSSHIIHDSGTGPTPDLLAVSLDGQVALVNYAGTARFYWLSSGNYVDTDLPLSITGLSLYDQVFTFSRSGGFLYYSCLATDGTTPGSAQIYKMLVDEESPVITENTDVRPAAGFALMVDGADGYFYLFSQDYLATLDTDTLEIEQEITGTDLYPYEVIGLHGGGPFGSVYGMAFRYGNPGPGGSSSSSGSASGGSSGSSADGGGSDSPGSSGGGDSSGGGGGSSGGGGGGSDSGSSQEGGTSDGSSSSSTQPVASSSSSASAGPTPTSSSSSASQSPEDSSSSSFASNTSGESSASNSQSSSSSEPPPPQSSSSGDCCVHSQPGYDGFAPVCYTEETTEDEQVFHVRLGPVEVPRGPWTLLSNEEVTGQLFFVVPGDLPVGGEYTVEYVYQPDTGEGGHSKFFCIIVDIPSASSSGSGLDGSSSGGSSGSGFSSSSSGTCCITLAPGQENTAAPVCGTEATSDTDHNWYVWLDGELQEPDDWGHETDDTPTGTADITVPEDLTIGGTYTLQYVYDPSPDGEPTGSLKSFCVIVPVPSSSSSSSSSQSESPSDSSTSGGGGDCQHVIAGVKQEVLPDREGPFETSETAHNWHVYYLPGGAAPPVPVDITYWVLKTFNDPYSRAKIVVPLGSAEGYYTLNYTFRTAIPGRIGLFKSYCIYVEASSSNSGGGSESSSSGIECGELEVIGRACHVAGIRFYREDWAPTGRFYAVVYLLGPADLAAHEVGLHNPVKFYTVTGFADDQEWIDVAIRETPPKFTSNHEYTIFAEYYEYADGMLGAYVGSSCQLVYQYNDALDCPGGDKSGPPCEVCEDFKALNQ